MWNCSYLPDMIDLMRNHSEHSGCYLQAFAAPLCWVTLTTQGKKSMDSNDYETLMWALKPMAGVMPFLKTKLLTSVDIPQLKNMMDILKDMYDRIPVGQRAHVAEWAKDQITKNYFNCTMKPCYPMLKGVYMCDPSLKWLNLEALTIMGPFLSYLTPTDVDSSPKVELCEFFSSEKFKSTMKVTRMNPTLSKKFLQRISKECFDSQEFPKHVDKLGPLACYYDPPELNQDLSEKLLSQLDNCDSSQIIKVYFTYLCLPKLSHLSSLAKGQSNPFFCELFHESQ
ncbi:uncharacterized protein LOC115794039 [Archocentrus centrarchus]|uniref:uncharacterized protein LOC115794039 n=1 Tax=Archocentrus centrarchus TaxID=63155 RepID=UPI0011E9BB39|nr:uncharacterized protein LOC115794039 [Archocentrus centrarchus]